MIPAAHIDAAGRIYLAGIRAHGALDGAVAETLRGMARLDDAARGFAVDTAQAMFRSRARIDDAARHLPFEPTRHALVCLFLVGARGVAARSLPGDPRLVTAFADAWAHTHAAPLHVRASLPAWLCQCILEERGAQQGEVLCLAMTETPPTTLRANTLRGERDGLREVLLQDGIDTVETALSPDGVTLRARANVFRTHAFRDGLFEVQDEGSQLVSLLCGAAPGMTVVDGCAGAGGKTLHLAARMKGKGSLYAFDVNRRRLEALRQRAARADAHNVRVALLDDGDPRAALTGRADAVLVDAPCSGSGVLRRNPDTSWQLQEEDVARMGVQQREILDAYAPLVRVGGRLVYATCSLLPQENQQQASAFLQRHANFTTLDAGAVLAQQGVSWPGASFTIDPLCAVRCDGFFAAVFERRA